MAERNVFIADSEKLIAIILIIIVIVIATVTVTVIVTATAILLSSSLLLNITMKGQSEIAYLPKFANMMLIVMVIVITEILYIILNFDCFENQ